MYNLSCFTGLYKKEINEIAFNHTSKNLDFPIRNDLVYGITFYCYPTHMVTMVNLRQLELQSKEANQEIKNKIIDFV